ncbi:hypothetical protein BS17DRAFT_198046 [Gyrodon lividus]|nr:hypothetical protein BS17DRAFT_198046 [Gyrodon lividus]
MVSHDDVHTAFSLHNPSCITHSGHVCAGGRMSWSPHEVLIVPVQWHNLSTPDGKTSLSNDLKRYFIQSIQQELTSISLSSFSSSSSFLWPEPASMLEHFEDTSTSSTSSGITTSSSLSSTWVFSTSGEYQWQERLTWGWWWCFFCEVHCGSLSSCQVRVLSRNSRNVWRCGEGGVLQEFLKGVGGVRNCGFSLCAAPLYEFGSLI